MTRIEVAAKVLGRIIAHLRDGVNSNISCVKNRQSSERDVVQENKYLYCATSLNRLFEWNFNQTGLKIKSMEKN